MAEKSQAGAAPLKSRGQLHIARFVTRGAEVLSAVVSRQVTMPKSRLRARHDAHAGASYSQQVGYTIHPGRRTRPMAKQKVAGSAAVAQVRRLQILAPGSRRTISAPRTGSGYRLRFGRRSKRTAGRSATIPASECAHAFA